MNTEECCNHNCNQGRDCPLRKTEKQSKFDGNNKVKELTDEEIEEVAVINLGHSMGLLNWMGFARAILRKATQE
jgi:hypothetical protein